MTEVKNNKKRSFILHIDSLDVLDELSREEIWDLFIAIKNYNLWEEAKLAGLMKAVFIPFKNQFDRDNDSYQETCEKNRVIAEKRRADKVPNSTKSTTGTNGTLKVPNSTKSTTGTNGTLKVPKSTKQYQVVPNSTKSTDNDNDNESKKDNESEIADNIVMQWQFLKYWWKHTSIKICDKDYKNLIMRYGWSITHDYINRLENHIINKLQGKDTYKDHFLVVCDWIKKDWIAKSQYAYL